MPTIELTQEKVADVDEDDYARLSSAKWHAKKDHKTFYAKRTIRKSDGKWTTQLMHREIWEHRFGPIPEGMEVDHKDRNGLNNRKDNLHLVAHQRNTVNDTKHSNNTSGFVGVHWHKRHCKWQAYYKHNYKIYHVGYFDTPEAAAEARDLFVYRNFHSESQRYNTLGDYNDAV
jgi:hypothetical protein